MYQKLSRFNKIAPIRKRVSMEMDVFNPPALSTILLSICFSKLKRVCSAYLSLINSTCTCTPQSTEQ